jgi:hypothetical protein
MAQPDRQPQPGAVIGGPPASTIHSARDVVSVACKHPSGFVLRNFAPIRETEQVLGGGVRDVTVYRDTGEQFVIGGTAQRPGDPRPPILAEGGYRITRNVPKTLWDAWYEANKASDIVRNRIMFASEKHEDVKAFSREHETVMTGLEGIDPTNPGKHVRGIVPGDKPK